MYIHIVVQFFCYLKNVLGAELFVTALPFSEITGAVIVVTVTEPSVPC